MLPSICQGFFLSAFLRNCLLCWHHSDSDMMPTLDAALLCSSRAGSDQGCESRLAWGALSIGFPHSQLARLLTLIRPGRVLLTAWKNTTHILGPARNMIRALQSLPEVARKSTTLAWQGTTHGLGLARARAGSNHYRLLRPLIVQDRTYFK